MGTEAHTTLRSVLGILWRIALFFVVFGLLGAVFIVPFASVLSAWRETFPIRAQMYGDVTIAVAMLASTWIMTRFVDRRPFPTIGFAPSRAPRDLARCRFGCGSRLARPVGRRCVAGRLGIAAIPGYWVELATVGDVDGHALQHPHAAPATLWLHLPDGSGVAWSA